MLRISSLKRMPPALKDPMKGQVVDELQSGLDALAGRRVDPIRMPLELRRRELVKLESVIAEVLATIEAQPRRQSTAVNAAASGDVEPRP